MHLMTAEEETEREQKRNYGSHSFAEYLFQPEQRDVFFSNCGMQSKRSGIENRSPRYYSDMIKENLRSDGRRDGTGVFLLPRTLLASNHTPAGKRRQETSS